MLYIALAVAVGLIGIDQLTKIIIDSNMEVHESFPVIAFGDTHILNITYERNTGAAFSILTGKQMFLIIITVVIMLIMLYMLFAKKIKKTSYIWCVALILAGGIGNLIDRITREFVVDFIDVKIINFAVFNVADICAVVGAFALVFFVILDEVKDAKKKKAEKAQTEEETEKSE